MHLDHGRLKVARQFHDAFKFLEVLETYIVLFLVRRRQRQHHVPAILRAIHLKAHSSIDRVVVLQRLDEHKFVAVLVLGGIAKPGQWSGDRS